MKLYKYLFVITILLFSLSINAVNAESCDSDDIRRLRVLASNVEVTYEPKDDCGTIFDVYFNNISDEFYIYDKQFGFLYSDFDIVDGRYQIPSEKKGKHIYVIYSDDCNEKLTSFSIDLYKENKYASDELCKGNENLDICKKKYDTCNMSYDEFKSILQSSIKGDSNVSVDDDTNNIDYIIQFISNNYIYVGGGILGLLLILIFIIIRKRRKRGVLE